MRRLRILLIAAVSLVLVFTGRVVWAEYIGPNRTTTIVERDPSGDYWTCVKENEQNCILSNPDNPCPDAGGNHPSVEQQEYWCGWLADYCGCTEHYSERITELPPAQVGGVFRCAEPGNSGWCLAGASIDIHAQEPLTGEAITFIEGDIGMMCDPPDAVAVSCAWGSGDEGGYTINYWAHSTYGDTSYLSGTNWYLDLSAPVVRVNVSGGVSGEGVWFSGGPLFITATGSDSASGYANGQVALGSGPWKDGLGIDSEGLFQVRVIGWDHAGRSAENQYSVGYDTTAPEGTGLFSGLQGESGWYRSGGTAQAQVEDRLSGIGSIAYQLNGAGWQSGAEVTLTGDGEDQIVWRVRDRAGNEIMITQTVRVDTQVPATRINEPAEGSEVRSAGVVTIVGFSEDSLSGIAQVQISVNGGVGWQMIENNGGAWEYDWDTTRARNGVHSVLVRAVDSAGNTGSPAGFFVRVDNGLPIIEIPPRWYVREKVPFSVSDPGSGISEVKLSIMSDRFGVRRFRWGGGHVPKKFWWDRRFGDIVAPSGEYKVVVEAWDKAGNFARATALIVVPMHPTATLTPTATPTTAVTATVTTRTAVHITPSPLISTTQTETTMPIDVAATEPEIVPVSDPKTKEERKDKYSFFAFVSAGGLLTLMMVVGTAYVSDRRYKAIWRLVERFKQEGALIQTK